MRAVNLLPREVAKPTARRWNVPLVTGIVVGVVAVGVLAAGFVRESTKVSHKRTALDAARAELALIPAPTVPDPASSTLMNERAKRIAALQRALNGRISWDRVLREVSLVVPDDVWLSALTLQAPTPPTALPTLPPGEAPAPSAASATSSDFTMTGSAFSHQGVARLLSRLALVPDLEDVTLGHSTKATPAPGKRASVEFSVIAGIRAPGGTS
jgi:Tfp pilus assembly protein PilN